MIQRATNKKQARSRDYANRGITICQRWRDSFEAFLADMGECPSEKHSIDRHPNNDGNYEPGNCRWATAKEQGRNTRTNHFVTHNGRTMVVADWAIELGLSYATMLYRFKNWTVERAITEPLITIFKGSPG
jgi:hypothetical protein